MPIDKLTRASLVPPAQRLGRAGRSGLARWAPRTAPARCEGVPVTAGALPHRAGWTGRRNVILRTFRSARGRRDGTSITSVTAVADGGLPAGVRLRGRSQAAGGRQAAERGQAT